MHQMENPDRSIYVTLEAFAPAFVSEDGVQMMQRFRQELSGKELPLKDVLRHVATFLSSIGYAEQLEGKVLIPVTRSQS
jgi:hypothetical protein